MAQRAVADGIADRSLSVTVLFRRHAQRAVGFTVVAAAVREASGQYGVGDFTALCKQATQALFTRSLLPCFRRHAGDGFKQAVEMERTHANLLRHLVRPTALTGAETRLRGLVSIRIKADIFTQRVAGTAGRTTINAGRLHGKDKLVIRTRIAGQNSLPAILIGKIGCVFHHRLLLQAYAQLA